MPRFYAVTNPEISEREIRNQERSRRIAAEAGKYLRDGAYLMLEIGWDQGEAVSTLLEVAGYREVEVKKDLSGNDRVVRGRYGK